MVKAQVPVSKRPSGCRRLQWARSQPCTGPLRPMSARLDLCLPRGISVCVCVCVCMHVCVANVASWISYTLSNTVWLCVLRESVSILWMVSRHVLQMNCLVFGSTSELYRLCIISCAFFASLLAVAHFTLHVCVT